MAISYDPIMSYAIPEVTRVLSDSDCILNASRDFCRSSSASSGVTPKPGAPLKRDDNYWTWCVVVGGRKPKIADVLERSDEWLAAIGRTIVAFNRLDED